MALISRSKNYTLSAWQDNQIRLRATQGEGGIKLAQFTLIDDNGNIDLTTATSVLFNATKRNGSACSVNCEIIDATNGIIGFPIETGITDVSGDVSGSIELITENGSIKFNGITVSVKTDTTGQLIEASESFAAFVEALNKLALITPEGIIELDDELTDDGVNAVQGQAIKSYVDTAIKVKANVQQLGDLTSLQKLISHTDLNTIYFGTITNNFSDIFGYPDTPMALRFMMWLVYETSTKKSYRCLALDDGTFWRFLSETDTVPQQMSVTKSNVDQLSARLGKKLDDADGSVKIKHLAQEIIDLIGSGGDGSGTGGVTLTQVEALLTNYAKISDLAKKEDSSNKATAFDSSFADENNTLYPTVTAILNYLADNYYDFKEIDALIPAVADGKSAYQIAVANGYEGTETEWLESLKGDTGADGYSPIASITQTDTGAVITITDKSGTTTATISNGEDGTSEAIEDYIIEEAERVAKLVMTRQTKNSFTFAMPCDVHMNSYCDTTNESQTHCKKAIEVIRNRANIDLVVVGGDISTGAYNSTIESTITDNFNAVDLFSNDALWLIGNHDDAPYQATDDRLTKQQLYNLICRKNLNMNAVIDEDNPSGGYGYIDFENRKTRIIYLNTDDKQQWQSNRYDLGAGAPPYLNAHNVTGTQLKFIAEKALDFSMHNNPKDWHIIVVSHTALNISGTWTDVEENIEHSTAKAGQLFSAYYTAQSGSITHDNVTVNYDFTSVDRAELVGFFHGHNHSYINENINGVVSVGCPAVVNDPDKDSSRVSSDGNSYPKTAGTAEGTSFVIITVDYENKQIYADHYGAGFDRQFEYEVFVSGAYTNQIPISTDTDGSVYNTVGYKEGYRLSSSGTESTMDGMAVTGFIPCAYKDLVYLQNVGFTYGEDTSGNQRISLYTADKTHLAQTTATALGGAMLGVKGDDNVWTQFQIPAAIDSTDTTGAAYFRLCGTSIDDTSIITVNEPIV